MVHARSAEVLHMFTRNQGSSPSAVPQASDLARSSQFSYRPALCGLLSELVGSTSTLWISSGWYLLMAVVAEINPDMRSAPEINANGLPKAPRTFLRPIRRPARLAAPDA
jgi:hypothetical protein